MGSYEMKMGTSKKRLCDNVRDIYNGGRLKRKGAYVYLLLTDIAATVHVQCSCFNCV